jgi:hypothetical protein
MFTSLFYYFWWPGPWLPAAGRIVLKASLKLIIITHDELGTTPVLKKIWR